jgi:hypothetical protein
MNYLASFEIDRVDMDNRYSYQELLGREVADNVVVYFVQ